MQHYQEIQQKLTPVSSILDNLEWRELCETIRTLESDIKAAREQSRNLRIAVVGQMKAGKSSFLNAAFFGRDLLPKAETPMTAALTKIAYAETPWAEVTFYSKGDWEQILEKDREYHEVYERIEKELLTANKSSFPNPFAKTKKPLLHEIESQIGMDLRASHELVEKVKQQSLDINSYLGTTKRLSGLGSDVESVADALHDYVGAGGRFTAITKMSALYVNDERLKDLEIYDTPGFNDPVISRGQQTRQFLKQCDVVFLLSTLSQFFANADLQLLRNQLSDAGIDAKAVQIIGSQRDIALRQDQGISQKAHSMTQSYPVEKRPQATVAAMIQLLDKKMTEVVSSTLQSHLKSPLLDDRSRIILSSVQKKAPLFISSWSWMLGQDWPNMSVDDREQFDALCRDTGYKFGADSLKSLSNIPKVRDVVLSQKVFKEQLLASKEANLIAGVQSGIREHLNKMLQGLARQAVHIQTSSIDQLQAQKVEIGKRIQKGRRNLENVFDEKQTNIEHQFALLETDIREQALAYGQVAQHRETKRESYSVSVSSWWNPFSWGDRENRYRDVVTQYTDVQDSIEQLERLANTSRKELQKLIKDCINIDELRHTLALSAMQLFDTGSVDFDPDELLHEVSRSLRRITIPSTDFGRKDYTQEIAVSFSRRITDTEQMSRLQEAHRLAMHAILLDLQKSATAKMQEITQSLADTQNSFVGDLVHDMQGRLDALSEQIVNREQALMRISDAKIVVTQCMDNI